MTYRDLATLALLAIMAGAVIGLHPDPEPDGLARIGSQIKHRAQGRGYIEVHDTTQPLQECVLIEHVRGRIGEIDIDAVIATGALRLRNRQRRAIRKAALSGLLSTESMSSGMDSSRYSLANLRCFTSIRFNSWVTWS